jgi:hypothetical protein
MRARLVASFVTLLIAPAAAAQSDPAAIVGSWHMYAAAPAADRPDAPRMATLELQLTDGALSGIWIGRRVMHPLLDLEYAEGKISFAFELDTGQAKRRIRYVGLVTGDRMTGRLTTPRSSQSVRGERVAPPAPPPAPGS